jgi:hypothetical protein
MYIQCLVLTFTIRIHIKVKHYSMSCLPEVEFFDQCDALVNETKTSKWYILQTLIRDGCPLN